MKIWIISDTHFGKYSNDSEKWLKLMTDYFYNWFIPTVKKHYKKGDVLVHLGDVFDNRTAINVKVIDTVVKIFEDLSKIFGEIHVIIGNHDAWLQSSTEISSACVIRNIPNIYLYDEPKIITMNNKEILMMPWIHGKNDEKATLEKYSGADLLLCHSDLNGCRTQLYPTRPNNRHILDIDDFDGYKRVFSGHIHIQQTINNFTFVGAPYHLDRNDIENEKGMWVYDTKTGKDIFLENDYSPQFKKIKILEDSDLKPLNEATFKDNFVDLEISKTLILNQPTLKLQIERVINKWSPNDVRWIDDIVKEKKVYVIKENSKDKSIKDWSMEWVENLQLNVETDLFTEIEFKSKMKEEIDGCFNILQQAGKS